MTPRDKEIVNGLQEGFPVVSRPFALAAARLGLDESELLERLQALVEGGELSRFGPLYNAEGMGGAVTLAALQVPEPRWDEVLALVNALPEVAHNYRREHRFNMWFVVAVDQAERLPEVLAEVTALTGLPVFNMPKLREFRLGFGVRLHDDGVDSAPVVSAPVVRDGRPMGLSPLERLLVRATQDGLPLVVEPYETVGRMVGVSGGEVMAGFAAMLARGAIRRVGVIPNHYRLGLLANGMSVWDVADEAVEGLGGVLADQEFISHCYVRPRHEGWPYNVFAMVHGRDRGVVRERVERVAGLLGAAVRGGEILFSSGLLKKTGLRLR